MERSIARGEGRRRSPLAPFVLIVVALLSAGGLLFAFTDLNGIGGYLIAAGTLGMLALLILISILGYPGRPGGRR